MTRFPRPFRFVATLAAFAGLVVSTVHARGVGSAAAVGVAARSGSAASAAVASCPSLANVTGYSGHARLGFTASASGKDPDNGDHLQTTLDRQAMSLAVDLTQRVGSGTSGIVSFIGHAHGGHILVKDGSSETYSDRSPRYAGTESFNGPILPTFGAAQLYVDLTTCTYKLHVSFLVWTDYAGSKQIKPDAKVGGDFWTAREKLDQSLDVRGGDGPDVYNHGCAGGNVLLSPVACYTASGGWTNDLTTLALCGSPSQDNCDVTSQRKIGDAQIIWVLKPVLSKKG